MPSTSAFSARAEITTSMCSFISTPSSSAARCICSRSTAAAKDACFNFFRTDFAFMPSIPVGRTRAQAVMNPDISSTAYSAFAISVSRGTPMKSAWPATASMISCG